MKTPLQILLVLFSLGLCVLLAFQWHREGVLRSQLQDSDATSRKVSSTVQSLRSDVRRLEAEIARVETLRRQQAMTAVEYEQELARLTGELQEAEKLEKELEAFMEALIQANENIRIQNEALQELAEERNGLAERYNLLAEEYNDLATRWNARLAAQTNSLAAEP